MASKKAIEAVKTQVRWARNGLELSDGGAAKGEALSKDLDEAWKSPKASDYQMVIYDSVTEAATLWSTLADEVQAAYDAATEE